MSRPTPWRCPRCEMILGRVKHGRLSVERGIYQRLNDTVEYVTCPGCGTTRWWVGGENGATRAKVKPSG